ncbi:hypothetical protein ILYODFUR_003901 [Ilyodon furcidens]|uniref:Uncharacterized protein n=1 Tax=Ilyodon furcidens TaxID=33524 RepID=A0ABV0UD47_9TELE
MCKIIHSVEKRKRQISLRSRLIVLSALLSHFGHREQILSEQRENNTQHKINITRHGTLDLSITTAGNLPDASFFNTE